MTHKTVVFAVTVTAAIALGMLAWPGAVKHFASVDQVPRPSVSTSAEISELPNPRLLRVRLLVSNLN
jgi:hypothetical protein